MMNSHQVKAFEKDPQNIHSPLAPLVKILANWHQSPCWPYHLAVLWHGLVLAEPLSSPMSDFPLAKKRLSLG
jgi:hypothetical protein